MTVDSVEVRKMQYARELAAYTMRQWNVMREALERERSLAASSVEHAQNVRPRSRSQPQEGVGTCLFSLRPQLVINIYFCSTAQFCPRRALASP